MIRAARLNQKGKRHYVFRFGEMHRAGLSRLFKLGYSQLQQRERELTNGDRNANNARYIHKTTKVTNEHGTLTITFTPSKLAANKLG